MSKKSAPKTDEPATPMIMLALAPKTPEDVPTIMAALRAISSGFYHPAGTNDPEIAGAFFGPFALSRRDAELVEALGYEYDGLDHDEPRTVDLPELMYRRFIRKGARRVVRDAIAAKSAKAN